MLTVDRIVQRYRLARTVSTPKMIYGGRAELISLFAHLGFTSGAEIGTWRGMFAEQMCKGIPELRLLCVDPWEAYDGYQEPKKDPQQMVAAYKEAVDRLKPYQATIVLAKSTVAAAEVPDRTLDFVYVDGNHRAPFVRADLEAWEPKVRRGGIIAGHDYYESPTMPWIEVKPVVDSFIAKHKIAPWFLVVDDKTPSFFWVKP